MAEFIGVKSYKAKGKRLTSYMVDNIQEIEPVVKKEVNPLNDEIKEIGEPTPQQLAHDDPAQMKLEL